MYLKMNIIQGAERQHIRFYTRWTNNFAYKLAASLVNGYQKKIQNDVVQMPQVWQGETHSSESPVDCLTIFYRDNRQWNKKGQTFATLKGTRISTNCKTFEISGTIVDSGTSKHVVVRRYLFQTLEANKLANAP